MTVCSATTDTEIIKGIQNQQYQVYFQPKVSRNQLETVGVEALIRLKVGNRILTPNLFFSFLTAKDSRNLQNYLIQEIVMLLNTNPFFKKRTIAVNIPSSDVTDDTYIEKLCHYLQANLNAPERLEFEIVERPEIQDLERANQNLVQLKALGIKISLDDFGQGSCSLQYLHSLPVDCLKIDQAFIRSTELKAMKIIESTIKLAHSLNLSVVAEGIETLTQLKQVHELGCDVFQGYLFDCPLSLCELTTKNRKNARLF